MSAESQLRSAITPAKMLSDYRLNADAFMQDQANMFRCLSASEQRELLFFMSMHASMGVMQLQGLLLRPPKQNGG
jgi:hypothetical protein